MALKLAGVCCEFGTLDEELMHVLQLTVGDAQQVEVPIHAYALLATHLFVKLRSILWSSCNKESLKRCVCFARNS